MSFPKIDGYIVTEKLGSGSYSTVYKAYTKVGARSVVAIKCVDKSRIKNSGSAVDNLITEIRLLKTLTHPHIVEMKNFTWDDRNIYIIMEFCCGGDLSKYIHKYGRVPEQRVLYFLQQLAAALKFLREKGVVHMDLKPHNLLLHKDSNGRYVLKVADFGFAQYMSLESMRSVRGSPLYMAPEMLAGEYDARVDLWSVGVIMYECLFGKAPYSSSTFKELVDKIQKQAPIEIPRNASISSGCRDLLLRLLQHDPDARISYEEFFSHPYLDLEYMPSKENYEKAVALIKQAVELDCCGRARDALACYGAGLRYLVPAVGAETDADRRGALAAKLARYMERAEEIKQLLKGDTPPAREPPRDGNLQPRQVSCCGRNINLNDRHDSTRQVCNPCACTSKQSDSSSEGCSCSTQHVGKEEKPASIQENAESSQSSKSSPKPPRTHFGLKRFFGRQASLPFLDSKDSSITAETQTDKKPGSENNDACRIT